MILLIFCYFIIFYSLDCDLPVSHDRFGFVQFDNNESAAAALEMNNQNIGGRRGRVEIATRKNNSGNLGATVVDGLRMSFSFSLLQI